MKVIAGTKFENVLNQSTKALVGRLLREHVRQYASRFLIALSMMIVVAVSTASLAKLMEPVLDEVFTQKNRDQLVLVASLVLLTFIVKGLANFGQQVVMEGVTQRIVADVRKRLFAHLMHADLAFFHSTSTGALISRVMNDVALLHMAVGKTLTGFGKDMLTLMALVGVMFYQDWQLALAAFFAFPTAILPIARIGKRMRKVSGNTQSEISRLTTHLDEVFQGIRHVKAYTTEDYEIQRSGRLTDTVATLGVKAARTRGLSHPIMETLGGLAIVVVIGYGGWQVIEGVRTTGSFFSFVVALMLAYEPLKRLVSLNANLQEGLAAAQRIFNTLDNPASIVDRPDARPLAVTEGEVALENVDFSYDEGIPALRSVNLTVPAGQTAALVGLSGAGKSTVLNLIPRFFETTGGRITIDGTDIRDVTLHSLRQNIALVSQEVTLFDDTIRANIAYGTPDATEEEIVAAARNAAADDFIRELADGYDTIVGERGVKLSGGQRQRVAIARAMLKNAPILLLDEATSALDTQSERLVQAALKKLMVGRTSIVIAHRLSTIVDADIIFVMDEGRIVEQGPHEALIAKGGLYSRLHGLQFSAEAAAAPDDDTVPLTKDAATLRASG
ncbi:MAG: ABC transporter ATP-binding protein/permease [Alphaproteobacteria bacterium]|nr:ABC transporter ATP-binding protein/permease [Alphaproteobacteria bacterium]MBU0797456.1 ABC transporter ATP-binding protein/permease [Alphaproteobacteria bacterium]MBU0888575.1 ABC transporter ATP-binding protein/permease [Alphaproteobacteria bacterium]MBU1813691.1 ABC transporter ATP-binding protein/permease [Alphaproteobacteria bacterium]